VTWGKLHKLIEREFGSVLKLNETKGKDYASEHDALSHFKVRAESLGLTPEQVWAVLAGKHWEAIMEHCKEGKVKSEPIEGRVQDLILYLLLLLGLIEDTTKA
jgi:hypothetical protein